MYNYACCFGGVDMDSLESAVGKRVRDTLLLDIYGPFLTEKQRLACELTWFDDMSLAEVANTLSISRQGVHDLISKARENMENFDAALKLVLHEQKLEQLREQLEKHRKDTAAELVDAISALFED